MIRKKSQGEKEASRHHGALKILFLRLLLRLTLVVCLGMLWCLCSRRMLQAVRGGITIDPSNFVLAGKPPWVTAAMEEEIKSPPGLMHALHYFDPGLVRRIAESYRQYSWVKRVERVAKRFPNTIEVKLNLRRPIAAIADGTGYSLIDQDFVRLSAQHYSLEQLDRKLPYIVGVRLSAPPPGKVWNDQGLIAAVLILNEIDDWPRKDEIIIRRVDISNVENRQSTKDSEIVLWTDNKVRINWGRSPRTKKYGELPTHQKLRNLERVLDERPGLKGVAKVNIHFDRPSYVPIM